MATALTWARRLSLLWGAAKGVLALHSHSPPIAHRDLRSPNILVGAQWVAKVRALPGVVAAVGRCSSTAACAAGTLLTAQSRRNHLHIFPCTTGGRYEPVEVYR